MQGSLFARPYENVKRAPQNDAQAIAAVFGNGGSGGELSRRTARHIRVHRISDVNAMDRAINGHVDRSDAIMPESSQYNFVNVEPQSRWFAVTRAVDIRSGAGNDITKQIIGYEIQPETKC